MTSKEFWCHAFLSNVVEYEYKFKDSIELAGLFADKCLKEYAKRFEITKAPIIAPIVSPIAKKDDSFNIGDMVHCSIQFNGIGFNAVVSYVDLVGKTCTLIGYNDKVVFKDVPFIYLTKFHSHKTTK